MKTKQVKIKFEDVVEDFNASAESPASKKVEEVQKKIMLWDYKNQLEARFEEMFSLIFGSIRNSTFSTETEFATADDSLEEVKSKWRILKYVDVFTNFPESEELKNDKGENYKTQEGANIIAPKTLIAIPDLVVNEKKFEFILDSKTAENVVSLIKKGIEDAKNPQTKYRFMKGNEMFVGTWYRKHYKALVEAKETEDKPKK